MARCCVDGCEKDAESRGFCGTHYMRERRLGRVPIGNRAPAPVEERFWRWVDKSGSCWTWTGGQKTAKGYGRIGAGGRGAPYILAHRLSYEIHKGPIPEGMVVMHSCDNPSCVNPAHLRVGTASENIKEAYDKRRKVSPFKKGADHHGAVLDDDMVRFIRSNPQIKGSVLARKFGASPSAVSAVRRGQSWTHVK